MNLKVSAPARPTRILVAGDRAISRDLLTMVLRGLRYDVRTAAAGAEALTQLEAEPYALVLVDATLPDMDGCELVRRIRRRAVDGGPPVVVIGDNGDPCGRARCLEAGAQDHLPRPVQLDRLLAVVRRMTSSRDREPAVGGAPELPLMDLVHLRSFTDGDAQLEQELGALYLATADLYLARMAAALEGHGGGDWSSAAHALKGASANLGARRVAALAAAAEKAPAEPDRLAALRRAIEEVRAFFERGRG